MRTPRTGSASSGETTGQSRSGGTLSSMSRAAMRTMGSASDRPARATSRVSGETWPASSAIAPARAKAGALVSAATAASRIAAPGSSCHAAWNACSIILQTFALRPEPAFDRSGRPRRALILMAIVAGVARLVLVREVRAGNAEAVIVPLVDHHEGALGHMAGDASERRVDPLVMVVRGLCVSIGVTLQADLVA